MSAPAMRPAVRRFRSAVWLKRRLRRALRAIGLTGRRMVLVADERPVATLVGNNRVLVGTRVGDWTMAYYVEADDRLLAPWFIVTGRYEVDLTDYLVRRLGRDSHCLDIGSNLGFFTCLMARHCPGGRVLGIEPDQRLADLTRDNLFINGLHGVADILCAAASDNDEGLTLYRRAMRSGNTSIVDVGTALTTALGEPPVEPFRVASVRIDDLASRLGSRVDFIKIDVEGAEPLVLAGARETIRRNPDITIVMEWSPGQIAAAGFDLARFVADIAAMGLRCFVIDGAMERSVKLETLAAMPYQAGMVLRRRDRGW